MGIGLRQQDADADLYLEDANGTVLGSSESGADANEWIAQTLQAGTYFVRVEAQQAGSNEYRLRYGVTAPPPNSAATGQPAVTGTAAVGETLTADTSGVSDANGLSNVVFAFQWIRSTDGTDTDIAGATGSSYTLTNADEDHAIQVRVTFTDDDGYAETLASDAVAMESAATAVWSATLTVGVDESSVPEVAGFGLWGEWLGPPDWTVDSTGSPRATSSMSRPGGLSGGVGMVKWMVARPGLTRIALTNDRTNARGSVIALLCRNALISLAKAAILSALPSISRHSASMARDGRHRSAGAASTTQVAVSLTATQ